MRGQADIGVVGLGVMGENLILNMERRGFTVACFNRTPSKVDAFVQGRGAGKNIIGCHDLGGLVAVLKRPRQILCMIPAGQAVDALLAELRGLLSAGDVVIDGGNSHFLDTARRVQEMERAGFWLVGAGISGGAQGALLGPSIMPGGSPAAWEVVHPVLQRICAVTDAGVPCCDWVGEGGAGHFVKMVHNGIEYGDMQLIAEVYHLMRSGLGLRPQEMAQVFARWDRGPLQSYLISITSRILEHTDAHGRPTVDGILDVAGQKGTGAWSVATALEMAVPLSLIAEAVFARALSGLKDERAAASRSLRGPGARGGEDAKSVIQDLMQALYAAKIVSYAQGFQLMRAVAQAQGWRLDYGRIALLWREGCIIRAAFLEDIHRAFGAAPDLSNLMLAPFFADALHRAQAGWRRSVTRAVQWGIPVPALSAALAYYDGYRTEQLPANLLQAQRDYFGAHAYERVDAPRGMLFHTEWTRAPQNPAAPADPPLLSRRGQTGVW